MNDHIVRDGDKITNEELGIFTRRSDEIKRRITEGTIGLEWSLAKMQKIVEGPKPAETDSYPVWKSLQVGTRRFAQELLKDLKKVGCVVEDESIFFSGDFVLAPKETQIDLTLIDLKNFGKKFTSSRNRIYYEALHCGLELCIHEVAVQIALQFGGEISEGQAIFVGTLPIDQYRWDEKAKDVDGHTSKYLYLIRYKGGEHKGKLGIDVYTGPNEDSCWDQRKMVFIKPRL